MLSKKIKTKLFLISLLATIVAIAMLFSSCHTLLDVLIGDDTTDITTALPSVENESTKTTKGDNRPDGTGYSFLKGRVWSVLSDGSLLYLNEDNSFFWHRASEENQDFYYSGTYEVYRGIAAVEYLKEDKAAIESYVKSFYSKKGQEGSLDDYYCLSLKNGSESDEEAAGIITDYSGCAYYDEVGKYAVELTNLSTFNVNDFVFNKDIVSGDL